jgi:hypothetical protein
MAKHLKAIAPRAPTPSPSSASAIRSSGRIPENVLQEHVRRLTASCMVIIGCWTFGLAMDAVAIPALLKLPRNPTALAIEVVGITLSAVMFAYLRSSGHRADTKTTMGLVFMVANALGIALMNASALGGTMPNLPMVSCRPRRRGGC